MTAPASEMGRATALLDFWFGPLGFPYHDQPRGLWFQTNAEFDAELRRNFLADQERAAAGDYDDWMQARDSCLALILLLDQLPRNLYRDTPAAFASDDKARTVARHALKRGFDKGLANVRRWFLYLPFEHSESLTDQETSVALFAALPKSTTDDGTLDYAKRHHEVIRRFGRFPHRNAILGRVSTPDEEAFLRQPGATF